MVYEINTIGHILFENSDIEEASEFCCKSIYTKEFTSREDAEAWIDHYNATKLRRWLDGEGGETPFQYWIPEVAILKRVAEKHGYEVIEPRQTYCEIRLK